MESELTYALSIFDAVSTRSVPHILEKIFFSLDYNSFKKCMKVSNIWRQILSTKSYQRRLEDLFDENKKNEQNLYAASKHGYTEMVRILCTQFMVNVNVVVRVGKWQHSFPLMEAVRGGHKEVVCILLDAGALVNEADKYGITPLHLAADHGQIDIVKILLDSGADVNKASASGNTPLHLGVRNGHDEVIQLLLKGGARVDAEDEYGCTPLMSAIYHGGQQKNSVKFLVKGGADVNRKNTWGRTPLQEATILGYKDVARELQEEGAILDGGFSKIFGQW